ncbi:MAG: cupin domain-containing protein [Vicinamibacteria bacterium]
MIASRLTLAAMIAMTTLGSASDQTPPAEGGGTSPTTIISAADLTAAFAKSKSFLETPEYRISTARREGPGDVEIHTVDTDIFYVIEGTATLVTGGEMLESRQTGPHEFRGSSIKGGVTKTVGKGDMIIIPKNDPHWFKEVKAPFIYLVIKSTSRSSVDLKG